MCEHVEISPGVVAIICRGHHRSARPRACSVCHHPGAEYLCDHPKGAGTCSKPLCFRCAVVTGTDRHECPVHALEARQQELLDDQIGWAL